MVRRLLTGFLAGGLAGAATIAGVFLVLATFDGTRPDEAIAYGLLAAVIGGSLGGLVGAIVGLGNMRRIGGALVGLVMSILVVVSYMTSFVGEGTFMQLLNRSRIIMVFTVAPLILSGIVASWAVRRWGS